MIPTVIDISWLNGVWTEWPDNSPITGVVIKASEGLAIDPYFVRNANFLKDRTRVSAYHFFRPCRTDSFRYMDWRDWIDAQAELFCTQYNAAGLGDEGLPPYLDMEDSDRERNPWGVWVYLKNEDRLARIRRWLEYVESELGIVPGIYAGYYRWKDIGGESATWAERYPYIMPQYPYDKRKDFKEIYRRFISGDYPVTFPVPPKPWKYSYMWQWTGYGDPADVPGHPEGKKAVDMNMEYKGEIPPVVTPPSQEGEFVVNWDNLKVFTGPSDATKQLPALKRGTRVQVLQTTTINGTEWARLVYPAGWCRAMYLVEA